MELLFSYGTLQEEPVQLRTYGRILTGTKDVLEGYIFDWITVHDKAFLATGADPRQRTLVQTGNISDQIEGTVFPISEEELHKTDSYEPVNYKRKKVTLRSGSRAWVYMAGKEE
jgi:Gamma-glutamyl cyclotransferase, AIG2-like